MRVNILSDHHKLNLKTNIAVRLTVFPLGDKLHTVTYAKKFYIVPDVTFAKSKTRL